MKRTKRNITMTTLLATMMLLAAVFVFSACSSDDTTPTPNNTLDSEIRFNPEVWKMLEGTRATTFDNAAALQTEGSFMCAAYNENTTTAYISPIAVNWSVERWSFSDGKHFWPVGNLDFFAYMPATPPTYITEGPTYSATAAPSVTHDVSFTCTSLPMTHAGQDDDLKEFVYALALGQNKTDNISGVNLVFQHPFARIKLQLSSTQAAIHINTITLKSIKNNGSYSHDSGWTPSDPATNFVATLNDDYEANDDLGTYIMIPQSWAGEIEVNATWDVWGESKTNTVTATVPTTWVAGHSYTYTFTISETDLKVDTEKFTEQW